MSAGVVRLIGGLAGAAFVLATMRLVDPVDALILGWVLLIVGVVAAALWHRRRTLEILHLEADAIGRWRRVRGAQPWPRWCIHCGGSSFSWAQCRAHVCAADAPVPAAAVAVEPAREISRGGGVDTLTDEAIDQAAAES